MSDDHVHKHYLLGGEVPVRVTFNAQGLKLGAQTPDANLGQLAFNHPILSRLEQSDEVEEITPDAFEEKCQAVYAKKKTSGLALS